jgi:hypothetical protein
VSPIPDEVLQTWSSTSDWLHKRGVSCLEIPPSVVETYLEDLREYLGPGDLATDQNRFSAAVCSYLERLAEMRAEDNNGGEEEEEEAAEANELMDKAPTEDHGDDMDVDENEATGGWKSSEGVPPQNTQSWALTEGEGARSMAALSLTSTQSK